MKKKENFEDFLKENILILDGAMGTMIQKEKISEEKFRGEKFRNLKKPLKGNNDILNLTCEKLKYEIHMEYLNAGADIIDIGAESTRPGAKPINPVMEIKRLKPVEPYKAKGIKERGQFVLRKEGKKK